MTPSPYSRTPLYFERLVSKVKVRKKFKVALSIPIARYRGRHLHCTQLQAGRQSTGF